MAPNQKGAPLGSLYLGAAWTNLTKGLAFKLVQNSRPRTHEIPHTFLWSPSRYHIGHPDERRRVTSSLEDTEADARGAAPVSFSMGLRA